jgi:hypothetical protein
VVLQENPVLLEPLVVLEQVQLLTFMTKEYLLPLQQPE